MDKPYILQPGLLEEDLREVFKKHGWEATDAYELAKDIVRAILKNEII